MSLLSYSTELELWNLSMFVYKALSLLKARIYFLSKRHSQYCLITRGLTRHIIVNPPYMSCRLCISVHFHLKAFSLSK